MGSAAAVADRMVPICLGTQTAGSVIRPAAFCGVVGYKATYGLFSMAGVKSFSPSLDTLGIFARSVDDLPLVRGALLELADQVPPPAEYRIALCRTDHWPLAEAAVRYAVEHAAQQLEEAGAVLIEREWPAEFAGLLESQQTIMAYEGARALAFERLAFSDQLSPKLRELFAAGIECSPAQYKAAQTHADRCRRLLPDLFLDVDAILCPSAPGEAPRGAATGDPVFNRVWTLLHVPTVTLPAFTGLRGLPIGIQLVADRYGDRRLLDVAAWVRRNCGGTISPSDLSAHS